MPNTSPLRLAVEESDGTVRLRRTGDFDLAGVGAVEHALDRLCEASAPRSVVFNAFTLTRAGERVTIIDEPEAA